jgi:hypothetical protein
MSIVDVWMRHPTLRLMQHEMFESLRRWTGQQRQPAAGRGRTAPGGPRPRVPRAADCAVAVGPTSHRLYYLLFSECVELGIPGTPVTRGLVRKVSPGPSRSTATAACRV